MRKIIILSVFLALVSVVAGQTPRDDIRKNIRCSASNYMAYPGPTRHKLTPPPAGMKPFYISHYGRHGSRYHNQPRTYAQPWQTMARADSLGKLTPLGHDVTLRLGRICRDAENHWGELTALGAEQHRQIAARMYERFPEVFADSTDVDARSTMVIRCILSMEVALQRLVALNPTLRIHHNATHRDMHYLNQQDKRLFAIKTDSTTQKFYNAFARKYNASDRLMRSLFNDTAYVRRHVDDRELSDQLFKVASNIQSTELSREVTLYDLFTDEETYRYWRKDNAWWYVAFGACPVNGALQPYTQRNLLRRIISDADQHIAMAKPSVQLRYGHETVVMPLACLLDIDGYGLETDDLESLDKRGWANYRIFPMAANIQFVFYRSDDRKGEVLFKVLMNENEAHLPLKTSNWPYYRWSDFKEHYLKKLDDFDKTLPKEEVNTENR